MQIAVSFAVGVYLFLQAIKDAKAGTVYWWGNTIALVWAFSLWLFGISNGNSGSIAEAVLFGLALFVSTKNVPMLGKIMQPADAKALLVIYFASTFWAGYLYAPLMVIGTMVIGHTAFLLWHRLIKKSKKGDRKPYFPFLFTGYAVSLSIYWRR